MNSTDSRVLVNTDVEEVVQAYLKAIADAIKGRYDQSVNPEVIKALNGLKIAFNGTLASIDVPSTFVFIDRGSRPHFPPVDAIAEWIRYKPVIPRPMRLKTGRVVLPTERQLSFLIARSISRRGTKGTHFIKDIINEVNKEWMPKINEALARSAQKYFVKQLKDIFE